MMIRSGQQFRMPDGQQGVVILEVLIAVLIFSLGLLGLVGLQGVMLKNTTEAQYRAEANLLAQQKIGQMWADTCHLDNYAGEEDVPTLPNGRINVVHSGAVAGACARDRTTVTVTWMLPGEGDPGLDRSHSSWRRVVQSVSISGG